jgi:hypothetical protein
LSTIKERKWGNVWRRYPPCLRGTIADEEGGRPPERFPRDARARRGEGDVGVLRGGALESQVLGLSVVLFVFWTGPGRNGLKRQEAGLYPY